ncbi:hypothetical protein [Streptomyces aureus]|uniref:hypothetical protein n=1 Tax=Streptomyces aureus TaxID=193461 RepID=UPI00340D384F
MTRRDDGMLSMLRGLLASSHVMSFERLPSQVAEHASEAGFDDVRISLGDLQRDVLRLLTGRGPDAAQDTGDTPAEIPVEGTVAGRAYQCGHTVAVAGGAVNGRTTALHQQLVLRPDPAIRPRRGCCRSAGPA